MALRRGLWLWGPVAFYVAFIFWLSSAPRPMPPGFRWPGGDKLFHLGEYTPLGSLLLRALSRSSSGRRMRWLALTAGLLVGAADEFYQSFVVTRVPSVWDVCADATGILLGQLLYGRRVARTP